jgi:hypothetical protein
MKYGWILVFLFLFLPFAALAMEVYLAPLAFEDDSDGQEAPAVSPEVDLLGALQQVGLGEAMLLRQSSSSPTPRSLLEAMHLCEQEGYAFLLYGYLKRTAYAYSVELKLLDRERGQIAAQFFASDDSAHYERLVQDVAAKVKDYFRAELGLEQPRPVEVPRRNQVHFASWLGYWTPVGGEWDRVIAGVVSAGLAVRFVPADPLFTLFSRRGHLELGLDGEYGLGMNEPGYESFFLHAVRIRLPLEALLELPSGHAVGLGIGLLVEIDTAVQDRLYSSLFTDTTIIPGGGVSIIYRYAISERVSVGVTGLFEVAAYSPALFMFSPRVVVSYTAGPRQKGEGHE